ncbi:hypothetical protein ABTY61_22760 [Kitasatospora sp. NPDC096128]|uniref:hypothetical protein n=1 Tax=Kitasatospora sp. NPDC096128 TaxID=3155547 RepID=UPI00332E69E8
MTTDAHARYHHALHAVSAAQTALNSTQARRPALTGDGVQDTQPYLLWAADMTSASDKIADAVCKLADAKEAAALATQPRPTPSGTRPTPPARRPTPSSAPPSPRSAQPPSTSTPRTSHRTDHPVILGGPEPLAT